MPQSLRGRCLIAAGHLRDPNFFKTVVLMVEHGEHGAMGLVVNRPSTVIVSNALAKHFDLCDVEDLVYVGGPVEPAAWLVLHNAEDLADGEREVAPGVYIGGSAEAFEEVMRRLASRDADLQCRVFSGCAGWAPGQLEAEIDRGDWHVVDADHCVAFSDDPYELYSEMLQRVFAELPMLPQSTTDPRWN